MTSLPDDAVAQFWFLARGSAGAVEHQLTGASTGAACAVLEVAGAKTPSELAAERKSNLVVQFSALAELASTQVGWTRATEHALAEQLRVLQIESDRVDCGGSSAGEDTGSPSVLVPNPTIPVKRQKQGRMAPAHGPGAPVAKKAGKRKAT